MYRTLGRWLGLLVLILSACGGPTSEQKPEWSEEKFGNFTAEMGSDVASLIARGGTGLGALAAIPANSPAGNLMSLTQAQTLKDPMAAFRELQSLSFINAQARASSLSPQRNAGALSPQGEIAMPLPRGIWEWDETTGNWVNTGDSDDLILRFTVVNLDGSSSAAEVTFDWDAKSPTTVVRDRLGELEVPTGMSIKTQLDGVMVGHIDIMAKWHQSSCGYQTLEPSTINLEGHFGYSADKLDFNINFSNDDGKLASDGSIFVQVAADSAKLTWDIQVNGTLTRDEGCFIGDYQVHDGSVQASLSVTLDGETNSTSIVFSFDNIVIGANNEFAADIHDGIIKVNGDIAVTFEGTLDDANNNGVPGENLWLTFSDGNSMTLEDFLLTYALE